MPRKHRAPTPRTAALAAAAATALLAFPGIASAATSSVTAGALTVTADSAGEAIAITCDAGNLKINGADPGSGAALCTDITSISVTGGSGDNSINLAGVTAAAFNHAPAATVTVHGGAGNDTIAGSELVDTLYGDEGNDRISGDDNAAGTRDVFLGGAGDDTLVWNPGDDDDKMDGEAGNDTIEVNGGGGGEQFTVNPSATAGRVSFDRTGPTPPGPFNLDIGTAERLDMNANGGDDTFTAANGLAGLIALDVDGGAGNDVLTGGDGADLIDGGDGNDSIVPGRNPAGTVDDARGGAGDDTITWNPGQGDDVNEGGDGNDTSVVNGGGGGEQFTAKPGTVAGRVRFDRTGPSPTPGPFFVDIGTTETLDLNMNGGDDTFTGSTGLAGLIKLDIDGGADNDAIDGGDGADVLSGGDGNDVIQGRKNPAGTRDDARGGAGDDTMIWNPGEGDDLNEGGDGIDNVVVNGGSGPESFRVRPSATPGRVSFDRTGPNPPGPFNIDIGTSENLTLNAGAGDDTIKGSAGLAGLITSTFNGQDGDDTIKGTDGEDLITGGKGRDLISSKDKSADRVECDQGFDFARVDRRDTVRACEIVFGGRLRVKALAKSLHVAGGAAALKLQCVASQRCRGNAALIRGKKTLAKARFAMGRKKSQTVRLKLTAAGRRALARAGGKSLKVQLRVDAKDASGNGWRTTGNLRLN